MRHKPRRVLVLGYGNPGRGDDGLGPALASRIEALGLPGVTVDADYQLVVEDAAAAAEHDVVVLADAAVTGPAPFRLQRLEPRRRLGFSTHSLDPASLVALSRELFGGEEVCYLLAVRGYQFDRFGEGLSPAAQANLDAAVEALVAALRTHGLEALASPGEAGWDVPHGIGGPVSLLTRTVAETVTAGGTARACPIDEA